MRIIMATSREEFFCGLQKPQLALWGRDGVQFPVTFKPIGGVIRVQDGAKNGRKIGFLPDLWSRVVPIGPSTLNHTS